MSRVGVPSTMVVGAEARPFLLSSSLLSLRALQIPVHHHKKTLGSAQPFPFHKTPGLMMIGRLVRSSGHVPAVVGVEQVVERGVVLVVRRDLRVVHLDTHKGERDQLSLDLKQT